MSIIMKELFSKIGILLLIIFFVSTKTLEKDSSSDVNATDPNCTDECLQDRQNLASIYNQRIGNNSFCDDFYSYACKNLTPITDELSLYKFGHFWDIEATRISIKTKKLCHKIIEESLNTTTDSVPYKLIKTLYKSCHNFKNDSFPANPSEINFILQQLSKLGGWPVLEGNNWNESAFDWKKFVIETQNISSLFNAFIHFQVYDNYLITKAYSLQPSRIDHLYKNLEINNKTQLNEFLDYMVGVAVLLGADKKFARKDLQDSLEFEVKLNNSTANSFLGDSIKNGKMSVAEMIDRWPSVNWTEFLSNITQSYIKFDNSTIIGVTDVGYVDNLIRVISSTPKRVQANYGLWRIVMMFVIFINDHSLQQLGSTHLDSIMFPNSFKDLRIKSDCLNLVDISLPLSVDALFIRKYVDKRVKNVATDMYKEIKQKLVEVVRSADWLDEETKRSAVKKAENIKGLIAYPDALLDDQIIEEYYEELGELVDDRLLENFVQLQKFNWQKRFKILGVGYFDYYSTHSKESAERASGISTHYSFLRNSFEMMSGYLQGLQFNINFPKYINFGSSGTVIGHELSHAYHTLARKYDEFGIENNKWTEKSEQEIKNRENCFVEQYDECFFNGTKVNGNRTLSENVADNVGVKIAYLAYQNWVARNGPEQSLPGLQLSPNQLFWLSYANTWCTQYTDIGLDLAINYDVHSPSQVRINQVLKNSPEFSQDFNCPLGSPMNPEKKCSVF